MTSRDDDAWDRGQAVDNARAQDGTPPTGSRRRPTAQDLQGDPDLPARRSTGVKAARRPSAIDAARDPDLPVRRSTPGATLTPPRKRRATAAEASGDPDLPVRRSRVVEPPASSKRPSAAEASSDPDLPARRSSVVDAAPVSSAPRKRRPSAAEASSDPDLPARRSSVVDAAPVSSAPRKRRPSAAEASSDPDLPARRSSVVDAAPVSSAPRKRRPSAAEASIDPDLPARRSSVVDGAPLTSAPPRKRRPSAAEASIDPDLPARRSSVVDGAPLTSAPPRKRRPSAAEASSDPDLPARRSVAPEAPSSPDSYAPRVTLDPDAIAEASRPKKRTPPPPEDGDAGRRRRRSSTGRMTLTDAKPLAPAKPPPGVSKLATQSKAKRPSDPLFFGDSSPKKRRASVAEGIAAKPVPVPTVPETMTRTVSTGTGSTEVRRPGQLIRNTVAKRPKAPTLSEEVLATQTLDASTLVESAASLPSIGRFGDYEILGRLAMGGMAEILLARKVGDPTPLVLKKILPQFSEDDEFVDMFLDEARIGLQLVHPNICRFLDYGEVDGTYFIAMEWINGVPLGRLIRRARKHGGISITMACAMIEKVADALHYAHTSRDENDVIMGLVHRDVSPHNIMVAYDGTVKLLDFGIAKAEVQSHQTRAGVVKGKFAYMAPEQCKGAPVDYRIDIFALGVVFYETLTGKSLYRRESEAETMRAIVLGDVPSLYDRMPEAPRELEAICRNALAKNADERYQTIAVMRDVLRMYVERVDPDVNEAHVSALVQHLFDKELRRGPKVDAAPFGSSYRVDPEPRPTVKPPGPPAPAPAPAPTPEPNPEPAIAPEPTRPAGVMPAQGDATLEELTGPPPAFKTVEPVQPPEVAKAERQNKAAQVILTIILALALGMGIGAFFLANGSNEAAQVRSASMEIETVPAGAEVFVDGASVGEAPVLVSDLDVGETTVRIVLEGHVPLERRMRLSEGQRAMLHVELEPEAAVQEPAPVEAEPAPGEAVPGVEGAAEPADTAPEANPSEPAEPAQPAGEDEAPAAEDQ